MKQLDIPRTTTISTKGLKGQKFPAFFPLRAPKLFFLSLLSTAFLVLASGVVPSVAAHPSTKLKGTLTIDYSATGGTVPNPQDLVAFTIPNKEEFLGAPVPKTVGGMPFRGQEFIIDFTSGCADSPTGGVALLLLRRGNKGAVFQASVTSGAFSCLFQGAGSVMPYDPFTGNQDLSILGEASIVLAQIFAGDPDGNGDNNMDEIRKSLRIPNNRTKFEFDAKNGEFALGCAEPFGNIQCNRGGSAKGIAQFEVIMKFKKPRR